MDILRSNQSSIEESFENQYVTVILGPRRVGKSYFVEKYAQRHGGRCWVSLNMDDLVTRERAVAQQLASMIVEVAQQHLGEGKIWVLIDEAQKCPESFEQIKSLYDLYKGKNKIKFILTGSAILSLHQLTAESLAGRVELHHFYPFNLRESTRFSKKNISLNSLLDKISEPDNLSNLIHDILPWKPLLEEQLQQQLVWGGFPEVLACQTSNEKIAYLKNYVQTYLEKDVRAIETITDINLYKNMLDVLAEQTGSIRDDQRIVDALRCTRDTLKKYRGYVEATLLYTDIYPYIGSALKRLVKSPKGYLLNNGLVSFLTGLTDFTILQKTGLIGHRLENWFLNELQVWTARVIARQQICYWRTTSGVEVDFIVVRKPAVFPFEVTYTPTIENSKIRNLKTFLANESKAPWGYYVYRGEFRIDEKNRIIFLPCWAIS
ncbi:MAG: AAA family ATPase [Gammaproteobacteria bacterium]|nr:AAA family ATPase [Gammaproteobacteria bacterium]